MTEERAASSQGWVKARYSPATAWPAEGARVGIVTCLDCGAAIFLSMDAPALVLHDAFHDRLDALGGSDA